jgi:hypothetical protein
MKWEPTSRLKGNSIVFDSHTNTAIIASEFLQTHGRGHFGIIGDFSPEEFLPSIPSRHMKSKPGEYWPEDENPEEEHEKYLHSLSISQICTHCKRVT